MAEFHLWSKETLISFAETATLEIQHQSVRIKELEADNKAMLEAWRELLRKPVPDGAAKV
jgi:hypothetical protein